MYRSITSIAMSAALTMSAAVSTAPANPTYEIQVITLTNQQRTANGCGALTVNGALTNAARGHSREMSARKLMTHTGANGSDPADRIARAGYSARKWAENVASGQSTPEEVVDAWMASPGHRANILDCGLTDIGVGHRVSHAGVPYWTQDFGTPA